MSVLLRFGARAHDFGRLPAEDLAARMATRGLVCTQLALGKAIAGLDAKPGMLNPGLAFHIGQAFNRCGLQIAVLGCYVNPIHPDRNIRKSLLGLFKEHLRFARDFGCGLVALETGSVKADYSPHPDNHGEAAFQSSLESIAELAAEAEKFGVVVGIEAVTTHVVSTPAKMRRMLDSVNSSNLQVVFDPVNLISIDNYGDQDRIIRESFDLWGDSIIAVHIKDFVVRDGQLTLARAGQGQLNHDLVLEWILQRKPGVSIVFEEITESTVGECIQFYRRKMP